MKNNFIKTLFIGICLFAVYFILTHNKIIHENILYAINLWITKVFPSLFPMFIINEILIHTGFPNILTKLILKFTKKINPYAIYVLTLSIFSGTPTNAIILKNLVEQKSINSKDASYMLTFTFFNNPVFLFTMLSISFDNYSVIKIIIIQYISNIIIFLLFKNKLPNNNILSNNENNKNQLSTILSISIKKSLDTLLMILGTITFYIIISTILINCLNFNSTFESILKGILEITQGLNNISLLNAPSKLKEIIATSIISFGGLSIHSQIQNIISDTNIQYKYFCIGRIMQIIFSNIIILIS